MNVSSVGVEGLLKSAAVYMAQQKLAEALKVLRRAGQMEPDNALVLYLTGAVHMQSGNLDKALELMRQAVQIDPSLYAAHFHIGFLLFNADQEDEAALAWRELERLGDEHPFVLFTKGVQAWSRDDFAACRKYLLRGLELNTAQGLFNAEMRQILAWADEEERELRGDEGEDEGVPSVASAKTLISLPALPGVKPLVARSGSKAGSKARSNAALVYKAAEMSSAANVARGKKK